LNPYRQTIRFFVLFFITSFILITHTKASDTAFAIISLDDISFPIPLRPTLSNETKQRYLDAINEARSKTQDCGDRGIMNPAPPVQWSDKLYQAAYLHSKDMALSEYFSHTGSGEASDVVAQAKHPGTGSSVKERIEYTGYTWNRYGENIAAGYDTLQSVIAAWLQSPGHCANIMNPNFKEVGMALYYKEGSDYGYYWTQDFATPKE
jgi:uncharacterized protein YkwD